MKKQITILMSLLLILILAACSDTADTDTTTNTTQETEVVTDEMPEEMAEEEEMSDDMMHEEEMADDMMDEETHDDMSEEMADDMMHEEEMADDMMDEEEMADETVSLPEWQLMPIVNAQTGETFTLADFSGKTVFVETMATWCSNCRTQLNNAKEAKNTLNDEDVVFIGLSVETNISADELANYAGENQFGFTWAVISPELLQALADEFGRTIANPPSTPHFIISPDGSFTGLITGIEPASELIDQIDAAKS